MTTVLESLNRSLHTCMKTSDKVYFIGEDVLDPYGGAFKIARGLSTAFPERVITTPISEAGIVGAATGMAIRGLRPIVEIMFGDFLTLAADQIINYAAKLRWMSDDRVRVPLVVRTPMGGGRGYGPTHSQSLEKHFLGTPGLRIIAATALDDPGKLLQKVVLDENDPVLFIEHKLLYGLPVQPLNSIPEFEVRRVKADYPVYHLAINDAPQPRLTLAAYGYMAELARKAVQRLVYEHEVFAEMIVFTQLSPFNLAPLIDSVIRTKRLLTVEEGTLTHGWGAEILAKTLETIGPSLQARRLAALDMPIAASGPLEDTILPNIDAIIRSCLQLAS